MSVKNYSLRWYVFETVWGWCGVSYSAHGVVRVVLPLADRDRAVGRIQQLCPAAAPSVAAPSVCRALQRYFSGGPAPVCRLDLSGATLFQQRVWRAAMTIPYGQVRTYAWLAAAAGSPRAARAVGGAMARNPVPVLVPCHRVVRADGGLGGFSAPGGVACKQRLLQLEQSGVRGDGSISA